MTITLSDPATKGTEMIRKHWGNCRNASDEAREMARQYWNQSGFMLTHVEHERSVDNARFWDDVASRIENFID